MRKPTVHAVGACTGLGVDAPGTMACVLAKVSAHADLTFGHRATCGASLGYDAKPRGTERLVTLGLAALEEVGDVDLPWPLPVILCCPGPDEVPCTPEQLLARLGARSPSLVDTRSSRVLHQGRRDLPAALTAVEKALGTSNLPACVLLGVDSLLEPSRLAIIDYRRGLRSLEHPDGVFPGEAAVALALGAPGRGKRQPEIAAVVAGLVPAGSLPGAVLSTLVARALQESGLTAGRVACVVHDLKGPAGMEELHSMLSRVPLPGVTEIIAPCDTLGETGAASPLVGLAVAAFFRERGVYEGAGLCISSDGTGFCGVAVVT